MSGMALVARLSPHRLFGSRGGFWSLAAWAAALAVALPILAVLFQLTAPSSPLWAHLVDTVLPGYVLNTALILIGVGAGTLLVGIPAAWMVTLCRFPGRRFFEWALLLPMAMPAYVIAYTYTGFLDYAGPLQSFLRAQWGEAGDWRFLPDIRSLPGAIIMLVLVLYPYVYLLARAAFLEQSACVLEVSRTLGCSPWTSFARVALPLARPALVAGAALAMMEAMNDYGTVQYFGIDTLATGIFRIWRGFGDPVSGAQLAAWLLVIVFALLAVERRSRGARRFAHSTGRYRALPRYRLTGWRAFGAAFGCALPLGLGFLLPAGLLLLSAIARREDWLKAEFFVLARHSFLMAGLASLAAVAIAVLLGYALRLNPTGPTRLAVRIAGLGYAIPGAVLAIGVALPFAALDHVLDAAMRAHFGLSTGLLLSGTLFAVIFAYLVRFLTASLNVVEAGLAKITPQLDGAARSLGRSPLGMLGSVHLPLLRGSLLTAAILVFVDVLKELPATLVLRPFDFDTLATRTFDLASDERLSEAAGPALAIVLVGILPVYLISRAIAASRPGHWS